MKTKKILKNRKLIFQNLITWLVVLTVFSIIFIIIALPLSWLLMHGFNWICSVLTLNYSLDYWPMFAVGLCLQVMFVLISILTSESKSTGRGKQWEHDMDMRWIESYTGKDYDNYTDPYDY
jgi:TRAP-type C4-dicarboxylate transport system permease small subunit